MSVGRQELLKRVQKRVSEKYEIRACPPYLVREALELILELLKEAVRAGERITISGFGSFQLVQTKAKKGRDFRRGTLLSIPPRHKVVFRASPLLLQKIRSDAKP